MTLTGLGQIRGERVVLAPSAGGFAIERGGEAVGRVDIEEDNAGVTIRSFCVDGSRRGYGIGSDAARALVTAIERASPNSRTRAWAPPDRGLAVYFWSRMGFRALHGEGPEGGLWLERVASASASV